MTDAAFLRSTLFERHGAAALFSLRQGGVSPLPFDSLNMGYGLGDSDARVDRNLTAFVKAAGLPGRPHQARQVHASDVLHCSGAGRMHAGEADILITREAACPVGVRVADCLPVLLADPEAGVVAAVHAGWRGTVDRVVGTAISAMRAQGAKAERLIACLGPCIGPCCFSIGADVADALAGCCDGAVLHVHDGYANLAAINIRQLQLAGIGEARIEHLGACTCCEPQRFFSYRRDGGQSGRHLAVAVLGRQP